ncbi:hypothetical protein HXX76_007299 [Chlamydomonas incerta]|uniref:Radical SAM core domain-containing protein n=1 Tax=Chlamydomonas incerta TaxID=51695 RepID=A0A835TBN4_CHLIN|nr:hypothetical protein HXX76_007299 [Chlamydomonas incerta]|eukprot:KAG2435216.1 hypothetical protein HXX76_007299 [Chlamydomonas incerta]
MQRALPRESVLCQRPRLSSALAPWTVSTPNVVPCAPTAGARRVAVAVAQPAAPVVSSPSSHATTSTHLHAADELQPAEQLSVLPTWTPPANRPGLYDAQGRLVLKALTLPELEAWCAAQGEAAPANRALQIWRWMYADPPAGSWVRSLEETLGRQNGFAAKFVEKVGPHVSLEGGLKLSQVVRASDGTRKLVFTLVGGEAAGGNVETVLIPVVRQQGLRDRLTICVSSQVGCAMNCQFCYTGRMGLLGNLTTAQIVEQVVEARRFLAQEGDRTPLTNMVFMGMGEPLHNTEAVLAAADIVSHYLGLHISHNKITISTVGLVPEMRTVLARTRVQVALSLHATTDEVRDWIVPVNRRYDLATLTAALEEMFPKEEEAAAGVASADEAAAVAVSHEAAAAAAGASNSSSSCSAAASSQPESQESERWLPPVEQLGGDAPSSSRGSSSNEAGKGSSKEGRSLLVEYTMLHGINDTLEDAHRLADMLRRVNCKVNLIVFNPHKGTRFQPSTDEDISAFRSALIQQGMVCTIRDSRGDDEMAACGQLGDVGLSFRPSPILDAPERFRRFLLPPSPAAPGKQAAASPVIA